MAVLVTRAHPDDQATAECLVQDGSPLVNSSAVAVLLDWVLPRDLVDGAGLPAGTLVSSMTAVGRYTLSQPWRGSSNATLKFRHDHRNYAVHFELPVP